VGAFHPFLRIEKKKKRERKKGGVVLQRLLSAKGGGGEKGRVEPAALLSKFQRQRKGKKKGEKNCIVDDLSKTWRWNGKEGKGREEKNLGRNPSRPSLFAFDISMRGKKGKKEREGGRTSKEGGKRRERGEPVRGALSFFDMQSSRGEGEKGKGKKEEKEKTGP